jgi:hypothetical protein
MRGQVGMGSMRDQMDMGLMRVLEDRPLTKVPHQMDSAGLSEFSDQSSEQHLDLGMARKFLSMNSGFPRLSLARPCSILWQVWLRPSSNPS